MINGTSSSDPQSPQRGELFQTSVQSFDRTPFRAVSFFEFIGRFELSTVPSPQIRIRILELAILFPAFLDPAFVFQRTFIANAVEKNGASFPVFELPEKGFFPGRTFHNTLFFIEFTLIQTNFIFRLMCCRSDQFYSVFGGFDIIFIRTGFCNLNLITAPPCVRFPPRDLTDSAGFFRPDAGSIPPCRCYPRTDH